MTRLIVSGLALFAIAGFAALTVEDAVHNGVSLLTILSLGVLVVLGIGVVGALAQQPPDE
jgi:hypothetical protein